MVDRYAIDVVNSIGHGAFGKIFECKITNQFYEYLRSNGISMPLDTLGTLFAVKIQNYETLFQGQLSLLREIDVLMRTKNYPGTVEIFDFYLCDETKQAYLILRLAQTSLDGYIRSETDPFRRVAFLPFFNAQMLLHLGYLKHNSIAHRDIKPQNILLQSAPHIFGWTVDKSLVDACSTNRFYSIEKVYLENYCGNPIQQLCRHFQPMGQNCNCFISETENSGAPPPIRFGLYEKPTNENSFQKPVPERTEKPGTQAIPIKTLKKIDRVGSCPARNLFDSSDAMDEDVVTVSQRGEQQEEPLFPLNAKTEKKIRRDQRTMHFAYLCDFGLSKHMNKTHHSPYIVTPNFRAPELFDPVSFSTEDDDNPTQDQLFAARGAIRQNKLRSSLLLSTQNSTNSPSSSDPNDVSLKREEDLAYNESIDIWGLGCTLAQLVTGKPLFPGKNLQSVYTAIKGLLSGTSFVQAPQQIHRENNNDDRLFRLDEERGFVNAFGEESDEQIWQQEAQENTMWITSVSKRTERIRQRIFLQLLSNNEPSAQRVCDMLGNDFFDMLAHMLDPNPQTRLDAEQLFAHKFVEAYVQPTLTLIFAISTEKPSRFPPIQF